MADNTQLGKNLKEKEEIYRRLIEGIPVMVYDADEIWRTSLVSPKFKDITGYTIEEFNAVKNNWLDIIHPDDKNRVYQESLKLPSLKESSELVQEYRIVKKDGSTSWVKDSKVSIFNEAGVYQGVHGIVEDITERKRAEEELRRYAETQEVLMKEVNHRFKNNLASLIGILQMAEDRAKDMGPDDYPLLLESLAGRIRGLATVHNMLTQSKWRPLQLKALCEGIIKSSLQGMGPTESAAVDVSSPDVRVNSTHAHNLGLVINELAANSIKYAFPHQDGKRIDVDIKHDDNTISLRFKDNGPGYPEDIINGDYSRASIGLELIVGIVEHNLDGSIRFSNENGAVTYIQFENPPGSNAFGDQNPFY